MSLSQGRPSRSGGTVCHAPARTSKVWVTAVLLLVVVGSLGLLAVISPGLGASPASARASSGGSLAAAPPTHGDLVVGSGQTYVIQPTSAGRTYYQGGNITVLAGGTLDVLNVSLSFVQYVGDTGTAQQRLSHIYKFEDAGTVHFYNASLTTDVQVLNAYAKLNLTVTGVLDAWNTTFAFPGWIYIHGAGAVMTLNQSAITWNPYVQLLNEPLAIYGDTLWAPTVTVAGGGNLTLLASQIEHVYADNTGSFGFARPTPLTFYSQNGFAVGPGTSDIQVQGPSDSANLSLDYLYPASGALNGYVSVEYSGSAIGNTTVNIGVLFGGTNYPVASGVDFAALTTATLTFPFPANLVTAITNAGMLQYLNDTGDFGVAGEISVTVDNTAGPTAAVDQALFQLNTTGPTYNDEVIGSEVSAVDAALGFNWNSYNTSFGAQYSLTPPYPWNSNKLLFLDHSVGYLANITTPGAALPGAFYPSAVIPDSSSIVYTYRWLQFNLTGRGGVLPIQGATLSAFYAYDASQANNNTTTKLNDLQTSDPAIWGYLQYWDAFHGVLQYGTSNAAGQGFLLLLTGNITVATLPDGIFTGTYHVGISVPAVGVGSHWFTWSVSPFPVGVAAGTSTYNGPDFAPPQGFPNYFGAMQVASVSIRANGVASPQVALGQILNVTVVANDTGTATITQVEAFLLYNDSGLPSAVLATYENTALHLTAPGQQTTFTLSWISTDKVTGLHGWFLHNFSLDLEWNYNIPSLAGGAVNGSVPVHLAPSEIAITSFSPPPSTLQLTTTPYYFTSGTLVYNGTQPAAIYLYATAVGTTNAILIAENTSYSGIFSLPVSPLQGLLSPGTSYTLTVTAAYNHRETNYSVPGTFTVPASPSSPASFLFQTFLGLPIWVWLAIAGAAVVGIVLFLFFARRQAAGKLVECGECGNLIPEDATVCPKCGAEFESDLIRCSRCASTIPADSKFCPECAAQLLGKPGEAEADPEKQAYADFTGKYRAEAKRELGDNYTEGAFWDWWKRQPTYTPFSQWSLQQGQGTVRAGMTAPPAGTEVTPEAPAGKAPPKRGAPPAAGWTEGGGAAAKAPAAPPAPKAAVPPPAAGGAGLKACPSCGKEIPAEYLVCPFCNAVTQ